LFILQYNETSTNYYLTSFPIFEILEGSDFDVEHIIVSNDGNYVSIVSESKKVFILKKLEADPHSVWGSILSFLNQDVDEDLQYFMNSILFADFGYVISQISKLPTRVNVNKGYWQFLGAWKVPNPSLLIQKITNYNKTNDQYSVAVLLSDNSIYIIDPHQKSTDGVYAFVYSRMMYISTLFIIVCVFAVNEVIGGNHRLTENIFIFLIYTFFLLFIVMALMDLTA
jgi:hypothetical protein